MDTKTSELETAIEGVTATLLERIRCGDEISVEAIRYLFARHVQPVIDAAERRGYDARSAAARARLLREFQAGVEYGRKIAREPAS